MSINDIDAHEILDGQGNPTIQAEVRTDETVGVYRVPSGQSPRDHEGKPQRDRERYGGEGVEGAITTIREQLADALSGQDAANWRECDRLLEEQSSPPLFHDIGTNAVSAVSGAALQASGQPPLYEHLNDDRSVEPKLPRPMVSVLSNPSGAPGIRDIMVVPLQNETLSVLIEQVAGIRDALHERLHNQNEAGPWGGVAVDLRSVDHYLSLLSDIINEQGYNKDEIDMGISIDMNGPLLYDSEHDLYKLGDTILQSGGIRGHVLRWCDEYPVIAVEDPLHSSDRESWQRLQIAVENLPRTVHLFAGHFAGTQPERTEMIFGQGRANALMARLGQAGTMRRMERAIEQARGFGATTALGARAGETGDATMVDISVGWGLPFIRCGGLMRGERTAKYNRLLTIAHRTELPMAEPDLS